MAKNENSYTLGLMIMTAAALAWSLTGWFTRILALDTATVLFWRSLFGAAGTLAVLALVPASGGIASIKQLGRGGLAYSLLTAISMFFFVGALHHTSVAHVAVITALVPLAAALAGWMFLREKPTFSALTASIIALAGVAIMVGFSGGGTLFGDGLALIMTCCMAGMILIARRHPAIPALAATLVAALICCAATLPFAELIHLSPTKFAGLAAFGIVNQVIGFGLFAIGARLLPPTETALLTTLEAPLAPLWVWLAFGEAPGTATIIGGAAVLIAVTGNILVSTKSPS